MARPVALQQWHQDAANLMARTGCTLRQAASELGVEVTAEECALLLRRPAIIRLVWDARHQYHRELGSDPQFTKDATVGRLLTLATKLEEEGENDKSAEVLFKISKMLGWVGLEGQVNVFSDLTQKDFEAIRKSLQPHSKPQATN